MRFLDPETVKGVLQMFYVAVLVIVDITWLVTTFSDDVLPWSRTKQLCVVVNVIVFLVVSIWLWL